MTGVGHRITGVLSFIIAYDLVDKLGGVGIAAVIGILFGVTAPDTLEYRKKSGGTIIPHRTITHWLPLWVFLCYILVYEITIQQDDAIEVIVLLSFLLGYALGGVLHLLCDLPNPMGIPILIPTKRISLNLWKSGNMNMMIYILIILGNIYYFREAILVNNPL